MNTKNKEVIKNILRKTGTLKPTKAVLRLVRKTRKKIEQKMASKKSEVFLSSLKREEKTTCWCGGKLAPSSQLHKSYGICEKCGAHVNMKPLTEQELRKFYSFDYYWNTRQALLGHPGIKHRTKNDLQDGRIDYWVKVIKKYGPQKGSVLEVGCAHGVLLSALAQKGYQCTGVEVDEKSATWTSKKINLPVLWGLFPFLEVPHCDVFIASDVLEHSSTPQQFIHKIDQILNNDGIAFIQSPLLITPDRFQKENDAVRAAVYNEFEHLYIFNKKSIEMLIEGTGLSIQYFGEGWLPGHELLILKKKSNE